MHNFAIAHAMKKKAKKMAEGGGINEKEDRLTGSKNARIYSNQREQEGVHTARMPYPRDKSSYGESNMGYAVRGGDMEGAKKIAIDKIKEARPLNHRMKMELPMAEGGCVEEPCPGCESCIPDEGYQDDNEPMDPMIMKIMGGRAKKYSEGGMIANEDQGESSSDPDQMAKDMPNEFDDLALDDHLTFDSTASNSGDELGDEEEDHDRHDIVMRVLKSRAKKDRMPRPA